jgi:hypothetical protein
MGEVVACGDLSLHTGMSGKSDWDAADQSVVSDIPDEWRQIVSEQPRTSDVASLQAKGHRSGVRGKSSDACFRGYQKGTERHPQLPDRRPGESVFGPSADNR